MEGCKKNHHDFFSACLDRSEMTSSRIYNVVPSVHDERDFFVIPNSFPEPGSDTNVLFSASASAQASESAYASASPQAVCDLRPLFPPVYDQGNIGSCTAMAVCSVFQYNDQSTVVPSRLFNYYCSRSLQNNMLRDVGSTIKDATQVLFQFGTCSDPVWPYIPSKYAVQPPHIAYAQASTKRIASYARVTISAQGIESAIQAGHPVCIGILLYDSFVSTTVQKTGIVKTPDPSKERFLGGHAIVIVGYDRTDPNNPVFIVRNSWGASWGNKGYCTIPYAYMLNRSLAFDAWIILSGKMLTSPALRVINPRAL